MLEIIISGVIVGLILEILKIKVIPIISKWFKRRKQRKAILFGYSGE